MNPRRKKRARRDLFYALRRERNLSPARAELERGFERIHARLRRSLARMTVTTRLLPDGRRAERSFAESLAGKTRDDAKRLSRRLAAVTSADDRRACHRARIACKRLRYLLEPIRRELPEAREAVRRCRGLQDVLGELNDAHVLREELETAIGAAKSAGARAGRGPGDAELPGLVELTRRVDARVGELFGILEGEWLGDGARALLRRVEELAEGLERSARAGVEIERKYLLSALPVIPPHAEVLEVDQGWLPGERLRERVRRQRGDAGTTYWRTLKFGKGLVRAEIEERTTAEVFEPMWSLTRDCRIRKRRYKVREGELVFEIDEFLDRELFLAEVELASASLEPALPGWLAERVVREVTEDPRYSNFELAQGGERAPAEAMTSSSGRSSHSSSLATSVGASSTWA